MVNPLSVATNGLLNRSALTIATLGFLSFSGVLSDISATIVGQGSTTASIQAVADGSAIIVNQGLINGTLTATFDYESTTSLGGGGGGFYVGPYIEPPSKNRANNVIYDSKTLDRIRKDDEEIVLIMSLLDPTNMT